MHHLQNCQCMREEWFHKVMKPSMEDQNLKPLTDSTSLSKEAIWGMNLGRTWSPKPAEKGDLLPSFPQKTTLSHLKFWVSQITTNYPTPEEMISSPVHHLHSHQVNRHEGPCKILKPLIQGQNATSSTDPTPSNERTTNSTRHLPCTRLFWIPIRSQPKQGLQTLSEQKAI